MDVKTEKLDEKIDQKFTKLLDLITETKAEVHSVGKDVASLKSMTLVLYYVIISGIVGGGGGLLVYFIKELFSRHNQQPTVQLQQGPPNDQVQKGEVQSPQATKNKLK